MDLNSLSKEDLLIVTSMLLEGKTMEDIEAKFVSAQMRGFVDNLHTMLCNRPHNDTGCVYHLEKTYEEPEKRKWLEMVSRLLKEYDATEEDLKQAIALVFKFIGHLKTVLTTYDPNLKAEPLIMALLHRFCANYLNSLDGVDCAGYVHVPVNQSPE